ncbi:MAG: PocR ligand-binding domain-containing protein [Verrucomicrobia bacterium]|nr:PocR ligand-binding domain-containing protein [Verrucomicrobiota bacterium]
MIAERVLRSEKLLALVSDFSTVTGLPVRLATPLGQEIKVAGTMPEPSVCAWMRSGTPRVRQSCTDCLQSAMANSQSGSSTLQCPAGLKEVIVPLKVRSEVVGYLILGQVTEKAPDIQHINRWRHSLERAGVKADTTELRGLLQEVPIYSPERMQGVIHMAEWLAQTLSQVLGDKVLDPGDKLPTTIAKTCAYIRSHYSSDLRLPDLAKRANLSKEHFCSQFHRSTGLRLTEYINRVRIEQALKKLAHSEDSITDIALAVGFQSIPHFNRSFKAMVGKSPRDFRKEVAD